MGKCNRKVKKGISLLLSVCLISSISPAAGYGQTLSVNEENERNEGDGGNIVLIAGFRDLDESVACQEVFTGTELEDETQLIFPKTLSAAEYVEDEMITASGSNGGRQEDGLEKDDEYDLVIEGVTWECDEIYDETQEGEYVFRALAGSRYQVADEAVEWPQITVTVIEKEDVPDATMSDGTLENDSKPLSNGMTELFSQRTAFSDSTEWKDQAADGFEGGDGSEESPYLIADASQLAYLAKLSLESNTVTRGNYYKITEDIDLEGYNWNPISDFQGDFDGDSHTISNMYCISSSGSGYTAGAGLFARISGMDTDRMLVIKDINFADCKIEELSAGNIENSAGILAGYIEPGVTVSGCSVADSGITLQGSRLGNTGGLIGFIGAARANPSKSNKVLDCSVSNTWVKNAYGNIGGLIGQAYYSLEEISGCTLENVTVSITASGQYTKMGGMLAYYIAGGRPLTIENCSITGNSSVSSCENSKVERIGGLIGSLAFNQSSSVEKKLISVINCSSEADVNYHTSSSTCWIGGLIGEAQGGTSSAEKDFLLIKDCYASGDINNRSSWKNQRTGGLIGLLAGNLENCWASGNVSGQHFTGGLVGDSSSSLSGRMSKIINCYATGTVEGASYVGGLIGNSEETYFESCYAAGKISGEDTVGGFVGAGESNTFETCYAAGETSGEYNIGGFMGSGQRNTVESCYAEGNVEGGFNMGGFIGMGTNLTVERCWAAGDVEGYNWQLGGFAGIITADISDCFATGNVSSLVDEDFEIRIGGFIGNANGSVINNCYSKGEVQSALADPQPTNGKFIGTSQKYSGGSYSLSDITVVNCYYEKDGLDAVEGMGTCGSGSDIRLTALTKAQMAHPNLAYHLNENGVNSIWGWQNGKNDNYPYLGDPVISSPLSSNADLSSLAVSAGSLIPEFASGIKEYQIDTFMPETRISAAGDGGAVLTITGSDGRTQPFTDSIRMELIPGINRITIRVTSEDGTQVQEYLLLINREELKEGTAAGVVLDAAGSPAAGALVEVKSGGTDGTLADGKGNPAVTDERGMFRFSEIPYGVYSLVITRGEQTVTRQITVGQNAVNLTVYLPEPGANSYVEIVKNAPDLSADGLDSLLLENAAADHQGITEADRRLAAEQDGTIELKLTVSGLEELEVPEDVLRIYEALEEHSGRLRLWGLMDLSIQKIIRNADGTVLRTASVTDTEELLKLVITIPEEIQNEEHIALFRVHNGTAQALIENTSGKEGTYYREGRYIYLFSSRYSTYALAIRDTSSATPEVPSGSSDKTGSESESGGGLSGRWIQDQTGWWYQWSNGTWPSDGWYYLYWNNAYYWYHFNSNGYLDTGWFRDKDGSVYYLHPYQDGMRGYMYTGWQEIGGKWYYFETRAGYGLGALIIGRETPDGYRTDENGVWIENEN
ncbi:GLUG motif-containing protein [Clostridium sp. MCC353]|uniref:GLUG motif-containing protein n=1 Tax=Clostridium sp. MCC353 TaxID=2592646 RepID=UPI001C03220E|nr:GLUG motif-containing protein [Clostridium sp. MCC353]